MRHRLILVLAVGFASIIATSTMAQRGPARVETAPVETATMTETITVFGQVLAQRESSVAARVGGLVVDVPIRVGDRVSRGDVLARMDTELLELELARAEAGLAVAVAGVDVADARVERTEKVFRRAEELNESARISDAQFDESAGDFTDARGAAQEARARADSARSAIELARYNVENSVVRAPFEGVVLDVLTQEGQFTTTGTQIAVLLDPGSMEVEANVPARLVSALEPGRKVMGQSDVGGALDLTLRAVLPTEVSATRTRPVRFAIDAPDLDVAVGQPVTLQIPVGEEREVVVVPKDALVQARGGWSAFVNDSGTASPRSVEIGQAIGDRFEVVSGLAPGDEVVVRGNERLRPGQEIATGDGRPGGGEGGPPAADAGDRATDESADTAATTPDTTDATDG